MSFRCAALLLLPAFVDGYTQAKGLRTSNNLLRLVTGVALGVGEIALIQNVSLLIRSMVRGLV